ncbi:MAG TPA: POTRA domain-containing protein, partial [Holophagaceae bacterium]
MRLRAPLGFALLALASAGAREVRGASPLKALRIEGGSEDDQRFARAALGLRPGEAVDEAGFQQALAAVRLVDRFQQVEGRLDPDGTAWVSLHPLVPLAGWTWGGDPVPRAFRKILLPELQKGLRLGPQRLEAFRLQAERRLQEGGYPAASVQAALQERGRWLQLRLSLGAPARIASVTLSGDPAPYRPETLLHAAGLRPGESLWTAGLLQETERRIRLRFVKDHRLEGTVQVTLADPAQGRVNLEVHPGPVVRLKSVGLSFFGPLAGRPRLSDFVPLARAERYSPSLLDEGSGRIAAYYRDQGYPEARVTFDRRITRGAPDRPEEVTVTYRVEPGPRRVIRRVLIEGNRERSERELLAGLQVPRRNFFQAPYAKGETMRTLEDRLSAIYLQQGFTDVRVRRRVDANPDGSVDVHLLVREGRQRFLRKLELDLPPGPNLPIGSLAQSLLLALSDRPVPLKGGAPNRYGSDRRALQGYEGRLEPHAGGEDLVFTRPIPLVRNDLALVVSDLRQRLSSLGAANPQIHLAFEAGEDQDEEVVRIQIPAQPLDAVRRLVIQGSDRTRAEAVLREAQIHPGTPLDPISLDESQVRIAGLGAFQRVDLLSISDLPGQTQPPWQRGDLALQLQERSPWVFTESFGYDRTQGYHFGWNAQRLNVGG